MATPSNYRTGTVDVGANTYSMPEQPNIGAALSGVVDILGRREQAKTLGLEQEKVEQARTDFFGSMTEAQKDYAELATARDAGGELTPEQRARLQSYGSQTQVLQAALEQGRLKYHEFRVRQEGLLRDAKRDRPDLAAEFDGMYADTLGFDVRGAAMDYYNFLLDKTESKIAGEQARARAAADALKGKFAVADKIVGLQPSNVQLPLKEQLLQVQYQYESGMIDPATADGLLNELTAPYATTASRTVADAEVKAGQTITEITNRATDIYKASQSGQLRANPDGSLDTQAISQLDQLDLQVNGLDDLAALIEPSSKEKAEAIRDKASYLRERLTDVRQQGTVKALVENTKYMTELRMMNLPANEEAKLLGMSKLFYNTEAERMAWVKEVAPSIQVGKHFEQQIAQGAAPWTAKFPPNISDKVSGALPTKLINHLATTQDKSDVVPVLTNTLYSYGAQRVDGQGRVVLRSPSDIFGSSGSLYSVTSDTFGESAQMKALLSLSPQERTQVAYGLAMSLDRYAEFVVGAAHQKDPSIPNKPVQVSKMLHMVLTGQLKADVKFELAHSSIPSASLAPYNSYEKEAIRAWQVIRTLTQ